MKKYTLPEWVRSENMRWAAYQWENLVHFRRMGAPHAPFWCRTEWTEEYFKRLFSEETALQFKKLGFTVLATNFYKGYGLKAENEEIVRQADFVKTCHKIGLKVLGYINSDACYYETLLKEEPGLENRLQLNENNEWINPHSSYYPHKARLCFSYRENIELLKKVIRRCMETGFDGVHFDMVFFGRCNCRKCTEAFRNYLEENVTDKKRLGFLGFDHVIQPFCLPVSNWDRSIGHVNMITDPMAQEWLKFNVRRFSEVRRELFDYVKSFGQEKASVLNTNVVEAQTGCDPLLIKECGDCFYIESTFPFYENDGSMRTSIFYYKILEAMERIPIPTQWLSKNGAVSLPETPSQIKRGILEAAVYGGSPGNTWSSRTIDGERIHADLPELTKPLKETLSFLDTHRNLYKNARSSQETLLLVSRPALAYDQEEIRHRALRAMMYVLQRSNIPFHLVFDDDFNPEKNSAKLLILSNVMALNKQLAEKVIAFVNRGGKLLLTGESGNYNEYVLKREKNIFAGILSKKEVRQLVPAPELDVKTIQGIWGKTIVGLPPEANRISNAVQELLGSERDLQIEAPDGVAVEPKELPDGRLVLHIFNFNERNPAVNVKITFRKGYIKNNLISLYILGKQDSILEWNENTLAIPEIETYAVMELERISK